MGLGVVSSLANADPRRAVAVGALATVVCSVPVFLTGAMAVQLTTELEFGPVGLGAAVAAFFAAMAVSSTHLGRLADRLGAILSLRLATVGASLGAGGIALLAVSWSSLVAWLVLAGTSAALAQPAANRLLINRVPRERLGVAFGLKQSAPPLASMLAGLAVPLIALTVGWRWAYGLAAGSALLMVAAVGRRPPVPLRARGDTTRRAPLRDRATLVVMASGFGLAFATSSALLGFYVDAAVRAGTAQRVAALVFAAASLAAISVRLLAGMVVDRTRVRPLRLCAALLVVGASGLLLLSVGQPSVMAAGAIFGLAGTWGFPGVFWFALVRAYPQTPGRITGAMAPAAMGGVAGPVGFGVLAAGVSYAAAWATAGLLALLAAAAMLHGARRLGESVQ